MACDWNAELVWRSHFPLVSASSFLRMRLIVDMPIRKIAARPADVASRCEGGILDRASLNWAKLTPERPTDNACERRVVAEAGPMPNSSVVLNRGFARLLRQRGLYARGTRSLHETAPVIDERNCGAAVIASNQAFGTSAAEDFCEHRNSTSPPLGQNLENRRFIQCKVGNPVRLTHFQMCDINRVMTTQFRTAAVALLRSDERMAWVRHGAGPPPLPGNCTR
jgi:hypothetical protein